MESVIGVDPGVGQNVDSGRDLDLESDPGLGYGFEPGFKFGLNKDIFKPLGPSLALVPKLLPGTLSSDDGLEMQGVGDSGDNSVQGWGGGYAVQELSPMLISDVSLESQGVGDLGELFV